MGLIPIWGSETGRCNHRTNRWSTEDRRWQSGGPVWIYGDPTNRKRLMLVAIHERLGPDNEVEKEYWLEGAPETHASRDSQDGITTNWVPASLTADEVEAHRTQRRDGTQFMC